MKTATTRRRFLTTASLTALGLGASGGLSRILAAQQAPGILTTKNPNGRIQVAIVGLGGISAGHIVNAAQAEHVVAMCDCRSATIRSKQQWIKTLSPELQDKLADFQTFLNYREMLDSMGDRIDAVVVCTPDHNHAIIGMDAMRRGKHVLIEKPMCHSIHEAFALRDLAREQRLATQMGNEGHSSPGIRTAVEYLWSGAIGPVHEVYHWCVGRYFGGADSGDYAPMKDVNEEYRLWSTPVPEELAFAELQKRVVTDPMMARHGGWRGDRRWGTGNLGDWAGHIMDVAYWGLKIAEAPSMKLVHLRREFGDDKQHYKTNVIQWTVPERADQPELRQYWYCGRLPGDKASLGYQEKEGGPGVPNLPPKVVEVFKANGQNPPSFGSLFVGEKGFLVASGSSSFAGLFPRELMKLQPRPPETLPRAKGNNDGEWYNAIRTGEPASANFEYSADFTAHFLLGNVLGHVGVGEELTYDRVQRRFVGRPELDAHLRRTYRTGYEI